VYNNISCVIQSANSGYYGQPAERQQTFDKNDFTARRSYASAVLGVVILFVRDGPSVCPSVTRVLCN